MKELAVDVALYFLGGVGLLAIGVIPLRVVAVARAEFNLASGPGACRYLRIPIVVMLFAILYLDAWIFARVAKCLTSMYCGPGDASGWISLATLGILYLAMELVLASLRFVRREDAPN